MELLYSLFIWLYEKAMFVAAIFHPKAKKWVEGRKINLPPETHGKPVIWIHCASLGEYDMAIPLITRLKKQYPNHFFLATFFSPSGMEHYKKRGELVDAACYLPIDRKKKVKSFVSRFNPALLILVKYEFWPNLINVVASNKVPILSVNTVIRKNQRFFKWYGGLFRKALRQIDFFYTLNAQTSLLLSDLSIKNWKITGDTRYDRLVENKMTAQKNERIEAFLSGEKAIIIGSSWPEDEKIVLPVMEKNKGHKYIIAPHEIDERHLQAIEKQLGNLVQRYTDKNDASKPVLLLNTIGHLTSAYSHGKMAYIGGAFSGKLHNILEPMVYELPLIFGPKFKRYPEAIEAVHSEIAQSVKNEKECEHAFQHAILEASTIKVKSSTFFQQHIGCSTIICEDIQSRFFTNCVV